MATDFQAVVKPDAVDNYLACYRAGLVIIDLQWDLWAVKRQDRHRAEAEHTTEAYRTGCGERFVAALSHADPKIASALQDHHAKLLASFDSRGPTPNDSRRSMLERRNAEDADLRELAARITVLRQ